MKKIGSNFRAPPVFVKNVQSWAGKVFAAHVHKSAENRYYKALYTFEDPKNQNNDQLRYETYATMQDMKPIIAECKKLFPTPAAQKEETVTSYFPIKDIVNDSDWKYLTDYDRQYADTTLSAYSWPDLIKVDFHLKDNEENAGYWYPEEKKIELFSKVEFDTPLQFQDALEFLMDTVRHEVQHLAQNLLQDMKLLRYLTGLPPKASIRARRHAPYDPEGKSRGDWPDVPEQYEDVKEVEFYPRLKDSILEFKRLLPYESDHGAFFRFWIGINPDYQPDNPDLEPAEGEKAKSNEFFMNLKRFNPRNWKKGAAELWKSFN